LALQVCGAALELRQAVPHPRGLQPRPGDQIPSATVPVLNQNLSDSSRPVRPRRGQDDKGRECLVFGRTGRGDGSPTALVPGFLFMDTTTTPLKFRLFFYNLL